MSSDEEMPDQSWCSENMSDEDMNSEYEDYESNSNENDPFSDIEVQTVPSQKNYTVLAVEDIRRRQADDVASVSDVLAIPPPAAAILLLRHRWSPESAHEAWLSNEAHARQQTGLSLVHYKPHSVKRFSCGICLERYKYADGVHAGCGHVYCYACMGSFIRVSIEGGPGCLSLWCPDTACTTAVDQDLVNRLCSKKDKRKYANYMFRSYIEDNPKRKWCPAPGCEMAVEFDDGGPDEGGYDVSCLCSHGFCWNCTEEAHRPVDCDTVAKWISKNATDAQNVNWILENTKPCPKCKRAIEKRDGCMHMTCTKPCHHEFCWICLGSWFEHGTCNRYRTDASEDVNRKEMARQSLVRYSHYYERWVANEKSRVKASEDLFNMESVNLEKLRLNLSKPVHELKFVTEAWVQIVECRRALKWSYAYGYYIPEEEKAKLTFFECLQGEAELYLEKLHQRAEEDLKGFLENETEEDFMTFKLNLGRLTKVTRTYFEKLIKALENGLSDVGS